MDRPGFSPVLLLGLGGAGLRVVEQTRKHLHSLPQSLQELVEVLPLDGSGGTTWAESLQAAVDRLKAGRLLQRAEEEGRVNIRRSFGPLEINVFLTGRLGSAPGGLTMDAVLAELMRTCYAWSPELGYTGASVTVLALMGGKDTGQRFVLNRMLETYRSDEFLDAYRGRIFLLDNSLQDGSKIEQPELVRLLARLLWLSVVPGDEPLLPRELGLIRMYEKEAKLATLGMDCYYGPWQESFCRQAAQRLRQQSELLLGPRKVLEHGSGGSEPSGSVAAVETGGSFSAGFITDAVESSARLKRELDEKLAGENPAEALPALARLENWLGQWEQISPDQAGSGLMEAGPHINSMPVSLMDTDMLVVEEAGSQSAHGKLPRAAVLGTSLLAGAALYRLTANQILPLWLGSLLGLLVLSVLLGFAYGGGRGLGSRQHRLKGQTLRPQVEDPPRETVKEEVPLHLPSLEELRRECLLARQDLTRLGRVLKETAKELENRQPPVMTRPLPLEGGDPALLPEKLIPAGWRGLREEECRLSILRNLSTVFEMEFVPLQASDLANLPEVAEPVPLLTYREGARPARKTQVVRPVSGTENLICVIGMYFGLELNHISLH